MSGRRRLKMAEAAIVFGDSVTSAGDAYLELLDRRLDFLYSME